MRTVFTILIAALLTGCGQNNDSWDKSAKFLTTTQPSSADLSGSYLFAQQTITTNNVPALQSQPCQLNLNPDGSFEITNYPIWNDSQISRFITTTGYWRCEVVGTVGTNNSWGIRFSGADKGLDDLQLMGTNAPYRLLMTYGDGDENLTMVFEKKK